MLLGTRLSTNVWASFFYAFFRESLNDVDQSFGILGQICVILSLISATVAALRNVTRDRKKCDLLR